MEEAESQPTKRLSWKRIILGMLLLGFLALVFECYRTYFLLAAPNYLELELPTDGLQTGWISEDRIVYLEPERGYRFFIWQKSGVFDGGSSTDAANELGEWLTGHGWQQNNFEHGFGYAAKFDPCQSSNKEVTDIQCRYFSSTTEPSLFLCSDFLVALYTEYMPDLQQGSVVVTTIRMSGLHLMACGLNYL